MRSIHQSRKYLSNLLPKVPYSCICLLCLFHPSTAKAVDETWEPIGPYVASAFSYAVHPTDPDIVYLGLFFNGIYKSIDGGDTWSHQDSGFGSALVQSIATDIESPGTFYASTFERGVFKTTDNSGSWAQINSGLDILNIDSLAISEINPRRLIASSFLGPYFTSNGGNLWQPWEKHSIYNLILQDNIQGSTLTLPSASNKRTLYIGRDTTTDTLTIRWFDTPLSPELFNQFEISISQATSVIPLLDSVGWNPAALSSAEKIEVISFMNTETGHTIRLPSLCALYSRIFETVAYLGTNGNGTYITADGGSTWEPWNEGIENLIVFDLKLHPDFEVIYAATNNGVYYRGASDPQWTSIKYNLLDANITQIAFLGSGTILSSSGVGTFALGIENDEIWDVWYDAPSKLVVTFPDEDKAIVAGTENVLQMTTDQGATFQTNTEGIQNNFPDALAAYQIGNQTVLAAGTDSGVWTTTSPYGSIPLNWNNASDIKEHLILELTPHPSRPNHIYAGTERAGVWFSPDAGDSWEQKTNGIHPSHIFEIDQSSTGDKTLYSATEVGLYRSDDNGSNWFLATPDALPTLVTAVETDAVKPDFVYYGTASGVLSFTANNLAFSPFADLGQGIKAIRSVPFEGIYVVLNDGTVLSSRDDSLNLAPRNDGLAHPVADIQVNQSQTNIAYAGTLGGGVYRTVSEGSVWEPRNTGMEQEFIFALAINPSNPDQIFATASGTIYKTNDAGTTWAAHSSGLPALVPILAIGIDPTTPSTLHCSVLNTGIFTSTDGGMTWADLSLPIAQSRGTLPIAYSTSQPNELFAGSENDGIQRLDTTLNTWEKSGNGMTDLVRGIAASHQNPDTLYAATLSSGVFRTDDAGDEWTLSGLGDRTCLHIAINPKNDNEVYVGTTSGLVATFDGGTNWVEMGQRVAFASSLSHSATEPNSILIAGANGLLFKSLDNGATWSARNSELPENEITEIEDTEDDGLYIGTDSAGVYRSIDDGFSWNRITDGVLNSDKIVAIAVEQAYDQLFIAGQTGGLYSTDLNGASLTPLTLPRSNFTTDPISEILIDPFNINRVFVAQINQSGTSSSLHVSTNRGVDWNTIESTSGLPTGSIFSIAASPTISGLLLCSTNDQLYKSTDDGLTWNLAVSTPFTAQNITFDKNDATVVYASSISGGIHISRDSGDSWSPSTLASYISVSSISSGEVDGDVVASTFNRGMVQSNDYGLTWTEGIDPAFSRLVILYVVVNPVNPDNIYISSTDKGILKSYDKGKSFTQINNGFGPHLSILQLAIDPKDPDVLYAGTITDGVYYTEDQGDNWTSMKSGIFHELTIALEIDPMDHRKVYAGFEGGGVYRIQNSPKYLRPDSDHDLDGIPSIWEQYLNLDPLSPNHDDAIKSVSITSSGAGQASMRWYKGIQTPIEPVNAIVQWSRDLQQWTALSEAPGASPHGTVQTIDVLGQLLVMEADITDADSDQPLFLRLRFSRD